MPFIDRDKNTGQITGVYARPQRGGHEYLQDDDAEVVAWRSIQAQKDPELKREQDRLALADEKIDAISSLGDVKAILKKIVRRIL